MSERLDLEKLKPIAARYSRGVYHGGDIPAVRGALPALIERNEELEKLLVDTDTEYVKAADARTEKAEAGRDIQKSDNMRLGGQLAQALARVLELEKEQCGDLDRTDKLCTILDRWEVRVSMAIRILRDAMPKEEGGGDAD